jgi:hypothetical protein
LALTARPIPAPTRPIVMAAARPGSGRRWSPISA